MAPLCPTRRPPSQIGPSSHAPSAASNMPHRRICRGTSRRIAVSTHNPPRSASTAARHTSACLHWQCMCSRTSLPIAAVSAARCSRDPETVWLRSLRQGVRRSLESAGAHADALGRQELRVLEVPQDLCP